jgi:oligopeptide transport system ATP-binding protein
VTARALLGLGARGQRISGGSVELTGHDGTLDLRKLTAKQLRQQVNGKRIAMVFQDALTCLDPTMAVGKQVAEGLREHYGMSRSAAKARAVELLAEVGIDDPERRYGQYPHQLSGGMCQRVNIAIALACEPDVLICDEPTTALDVTIQLRILDLLARLQAERGLAVVFITHDLGVVARIAHRVNVMYAGRIVEQGSVDQVFYEPRHPYTWGLLSAMPDVDSPEPTLYAIPGSPASLVDRPVGDAFAPRNEFALELDFEREPPYFEVASGHRVASWLCHPQAPAAEMPKALRRKIEAMTAGDVR